MKANSVVISQGGATTPPPPPPSSGGIWGVVDPLILGTCSAAVHDRYVLSGDDGYLYRTWHPQVVPVDKQQPNGVTCRFAHEHGHDPSRQTNAAVRSGPVRFGYIGRRMPMPNEPNGHQEPHEGFKVHLANRDQVNDEGRRNLHDSRLVFHMGTSGPKRFTMQFHSMEYRIVTDDGRVMFVQGMGDTGDVGSQAERDASNGRIGRSVMVVGMKPVDSPYEIWAPTVRIRAINGREVARATASLSVFDPITIFDRNDPLRVVYATSPEFEAVMKFHVDRSDFRGCIREAYHGPTFWFNSGSQTVFFTDAMGMEQVGGPLRQEITAVDTGGSFRATNDGLSQFKWKTPTCGDGLGLKN